MVLRNGNLRWPAAGKAGDENLETGDVVMSFAPPRP
jgi:hypothetical protein